LSDTDRLARAVRGSVGIVANLLVSGRYDVIQALTRGRDLSAEQMREIIEKDGRTFVLAPASAYDEIDAVQTSESPAAFHVSFPLWTAQGRSTFILELDLIERFPDTVDVEVRRLHEM
jgi:hypothetical protein